jgi:hypothetical protein
MAISTANTTLNYKLLVGDSYTKLVDITSYPDMGSTPSKLDTTDLTQTAYKTSIFGLQETPDLTFEANYDETKLASINAMAGTTYYFQLLFGTADGQLTWQGEIRAYVNGGAVDEVRKMTVTLSASTPIVFSAN